MNKSTSNLKTIFSYALGYKRYFILSSISAILRVIAAFSTPQIIRFTIDSIIDNVPLNYPSFIMDIIYMLGGREGIRNNLWICSILILILALFTCIFDYSARTNIAKGSEGVIKTLRNNIYNHIQKMPYSWHVKNQTGDIIQRATSDVDVVKDFISSQILEMFRTIVIIIVALIMMFSINTTLGFIIVAFVPIILIYTSVFYGILSKKFLTADEAEGELFSVTQENLTGVRVVRAFGREKFEIDKFSKKNNEFSDLWVKLGYQLGYYWGIGDFVTSLLIMIIISVGVIQTVNHNITLGEFLAFVSYTQMIAWPLRRFGRILGEMSKTNVSLERICEILREPAEELETDKLTPPLDGDIEFKNVSFSYENNIPLIDNISFKIKKGTTFAILGGTGSGKTTLMLLLNRLYELNEQGGEITIGNTNIKDIRRDYLRKNIGIVLQEPFLFSNTIKENITITQDNFDTNAMKSVVELSQLTESINNFSDGYETMVGERGVTLSGGQKQRVAIARMLLQETPIMIFDDSLSAIDAETDAKIREALLNNKNRKTTILISHRITTLMEADMILVMDNGKVSDIGTHKELISHKGIYKDIFDVQMNISDEII